MNFIMKCHYEIKTAKDIAKYLKNASLRLGMIFAHYHYMNGDSTVFGTLYLQGGNQYAKS